MERRRVPELNLSECGPGSVADRVGVVPGLRSSAAFFTFLRANLVLSPSAISSPNNTPYLEPYSPLLPLVRASPSPLATNNPLVPLDEIPPLSLDALEAPDEKVEGLQLVADSVFEMRKQSAKAVIFHPLCLAAVATFWSAVYRFSFLSGDRDSAGQRAVTFAGCMTALYLFIVGSYSSGYSTLAANIGWDWLQAGIGGEQDIIVGARYGESVVGALVLRLEPKKVPLPKRKGHGHSRSRSTSLKGGKGVIRAWTIKQKYRGKGIGKDLLHEAVRMTRERCGKDAQVGFAQKHAHSAMLMPNMFNGAFRRAEVRAAKALEKAVAEWDVNKKRRK